MKLLTEALTTGSVLTIAKVPGNCKGVLGGGNMAVGLTAYAKTPINVLWDMERKLEAQRTSDRNVVGSGANGKGRRG